MMHCGSWGRPTFTSRLPSSAICPRRRSLWSRAWSNRTSRAAPQIELVREPARKPKGRPRIFALEAVSEEAIALQADLERELAQQHLYKPEKRPFWPHVTVARVRPERRGSKRPARVRRAPEPLPDVLLQPFFAVGVTLYRSVLRPQGAEYAPLAQVELPAHKT